MITPTLANLEYLTPFATADEALADASTIRHPPTILGELSR